MCILMQSCEKKTAIQQLRTQLKLAEQKGINLQTIKPTGPFQTITYEDVYNSSGDPTITKRQQANKELIAKGIEIGLQIPQTSFTRAVNKSAGSQSEWHATLLAKWAKVLRDHADQEIGRASCRERV